MTSPVLPSFRQLGQAVLVGIYTAVMTFLSGLIGDGINLEHLASWRIAVQAGIAAALAFLGWTGLATARSEGSGKHSAKPLGDSTEGGT